MAPNDALETRNYAAAAPSVGGEAGPWEQLRQWVEAETGMDFAGPRLTRLRDSVGRVLAHEGAGVTLEGLLARPHEHGAFLERLTAELTVGESFFFRNENHFRELREQVVPQILRENAARREIRVWSAGCAGGEEPYSLAILLDQMLFGGGDWRISVLATDLNPAFLERAREGCFRAWSFRQTSIHADGAYFSQRGDTYRLVDRVRERVRFAYLNLVKDVYPSPLSATLGLDLILFRNVAIYLKPEVTAAIVERFYRALRPGGWLLLGEAEVALTPAPGFEVHRRERATFYRKPDGTGVAPGGEPWAPAAPVLAPMTPANATIAKTCDLPPGPPQAFVSSCVERAPTADTAVLSREQVERWAAECRFADAERALAQSPDRPQRAALRLHYAQTLLRVAESARARQMLEICLAEEPLLLEAHLLQASFAEEAGEWDAAGAAYRRALYLDRQCPMAHFHLALVQRQQGDQAGAARSLRTMLNLIAGLDPLALAPYGEGVCYGRLAEMGAVLLAP